MKKAIIAILLFLLHCSPTPRSFLDANTPSGAIAYLLPLFFPQLKPSDSKAIKTFSVLETGSGARVLGRNITLTVPYSTDVSGLTAEYYHTGEQTRIGEIEQISGQTKNNFSSPLTYTVTARNQTTLDFKVITNKGLPTSNTLLSFSLAKSVSSEIYTGTIIGNSVTVYVPFGTDVSSLLGIFSHNGKEAQVAGETQVSGKNTQNYSSPVVYTILSEMGTSQTFTVNVEIGAIDSKDIKAFWLNSSQASIVGTDLVVPFPFGTDLSTLLTSFIHTGSELKTGTRTLTNGESTINATSPVTLTVIAKDGSTKDYRLRVSLVNELLTIGGTVSGLGTGLNLSLTNNGTNSLNITSNGSFTFGIPIPNGSEYNVSIVTQPVGQFCAITGGSGVANVNVNSISVVCAFFPGAAPQSFTDNGNGTITDNNTKLVWMKCSMSDVSGVPLSGITCNLGTFGEYQFCSTTNDSCNGGTSSLNLQPPPWLDGITSSLWTTCNNANSSAGSRVGAFAGITNWRVPTKDELLSIVDYSKTNPPAINETYFPNTNSNFYRSATVYPTDPANAWVLYFGGGDSYGAGKTGFFYVRCVSSP